MTTRNAMPDHGRKLPERPLTALWALVPMKTLGEAKQRLAGCLGRHRRGLALAMFRDVSRSLLESRAFAGVAVVTADPLIAELSGDRGLRVIGETGRGMNEAVRQGIGCIMASGAPGVAVIPADVPLITLREVRRVLSQLERERWGPAPGRLGILPNRDQDGTNFLSIEGAKPFAPTYGPGSYLRHLEAAHRAGLHVTRLESAPFALDIDDEEDLMAFIDACRKRTAPRRTETWDYLYHRGFTEAGVASRRVINQ